LVTVVFDSRAGRIARRCQKLRYIFEKCELDMDRRELRRGVAVVPLEPKVFDLLAYLIANRERVVSKDDLLASVWEGRIVSESALTTRINAVRSAIGDSGEEQRLIKTLPRKGIRFVGEVREEIADPHLAAELQRPAFALPDRPSIAVLPFTNMSGDPEQEYFADGMAEEIITALSRCAGLFVIARNSSFTYKGKTVDIRQVGRELGVRYVLEGSVRRGGNRLRFIGQLVDATSGAHIWADRFDGEMSDVFELQDLFTERVVGAIGPQLQLAEIDRLKHKPAAQLDAYDLLLRAQQLEYEYTRESLTAAIAHVQRALAIDPTYAPAMALGAYCYTERHIQGWADNIAAEAIEGWRLAMRAVEFGKGDGNVLWMSAYAVWNLAMDTQRAHELVSHSLATNSNSAMALTLLAWIESCLGNQSRALELFQRAGRLSPRDPRGWFIACGKASAHFMDGRFAEAVMWAKTSLTYNPRFAIGLRHLAAGLAMQGDTDAAAAIVRELLEIEPDLSLSKLRGRLMFMSELCWNLYSEGLRRAGLPE
jgi:TolB-like protein/tetratricopeptide (TPR) repeat protein